MRVTEKLDLVSQVGRELQKRYTFTEIGVFLEEFGIPEPEGEWHSKWEYSKFALRGVPDDLLLRIAGELDLVAAGSGGTLMDPPANWKDKSGFRLFISHISKDKQKATRLKECLVLYSIAGFVAHEDVLPTLEWQTEIERGLRTMDAFIAVHTPGFKDSIWCQQEVGFAFCSGKKIISFKMGEDPTGFISKHQALPRRERTAEQVAAEINDLLLADPRTKVKLEAAKLAMTGIPDDIPF